MACPSQLPSQDLRTPFPVNPCLETWECFHPSIRGWQHARNIDTAVVKLYLQWKNIAKRWGLPRQPPLSSQQPRPLSSLWYQHWSEHCHSCHDATLKVAALSFENTAQISKPDTFLGETQGVAILDVTQAKAEAWMKWPRGWGGVGIAGTRMTGLDESREMGNSHSCPPSHPQPGLRSLPRGPISAVTLNFRIWDCR